MNKYSAFIFLAFSYKLYLGNTNILKIYREASYYEFINYKAVHLVSLRVKSYILPPMSCAHTKHTALLGDIFLFAAKAMVNVGLKNKSLKEVEMFNKKALVNPKHKDLLLKNVWNCSFPWPPDC